MSTPYLTVDKYKLLKKLGEGGYSKVYLAENTEDEGEPPCAVKVPRSGIFTKEVQAHIFDEEIQAMKELDHPYLVKMIGYGFDKKLERHPGGKSKKSSYLALELCDGGELFDFLAETGGFSEKTSLYYFKQMVEAMDYMHQKGFAHRDMKPENCMLDREYNLKIADFGFATADDLSKTKKGTNAYMAPEIRTGDPYDARMADIFTMGIILFIMRAGHPAFHTAEGSDEYYKYIAADKPAKFWKKHMKHLEPDAEPYSNEFMSLCTSMLHYNPEERINLEQIKEHDWYKGEASTYDEIQEEFARRAAMMQELSTAECPDVDAGVDSDGHRGEEEQKGGDLMLERQAADYIPGPV